MLDGRYPSDRFAELRPRIVWDRAKGRMHGRKGARQLVVTNAGTIPDRGLYGVHLPDGRRVGELDEEMVYEARPGQTFLLGATTWRIEEITRDRVIVTPAPGAPGAVPFWKGDGIGRPAELGRAIGAFAREAVSKDPVELAAECDLDRLAAENLVAYLREQQAATRVVPSDETIVVERFRDEIGDWRLCVLSPYGGRVHAAWGLALSQKIRAERDLEADAIWSDDGIVIHLPDADEPPPSDLVMIEPDELEDLVVAELSGSALFGARFRENAARSLLIPRAYPGKRTPLWQQRLKAQSLLEVARDHPRFPVVLETYRECLRDVLDLPSLAELLRDLHSRKLSLVEVETATASPFASSLLFDYVATYMYEGDTPNAERRAAALALDRDLLRELLGQEELRELIDPEALVEVEAQLQHRTEAGRAGDRDALQQVLRNVGDLSAEECAERVAEGYSAASMLEKLVAERRVALVRIGGEERYIAAEDAGIYRDALGVPPPPGLPESFLEEAADPLRHPAAPLRPHPRPVPERPAGRALRRSTRPRRCASWSAPAPSSAASCCPAGASASGATPTSCAACAGPASPTCGGRSSPPRATASPASCPSWQNVDAHRPAGAGPDRLREALVPLQGVALTPKVWESDVLPRRLGAYSPTWLDELCTSGEVVWIGAGARGRNDGRVALYFREDVRLAGPPPANAKLERVEGEAHDAIRERLAAGPAFWLDLLAELGELPVEELHNGLWDLAWAGEVTNDAFSPLRAPRLRAVPAAEARSGRRFARRRAAGGRRGPGPLVVARAAVRGRPRRRPPAARPGRADAGALRHRHPRDGPRRGRPRRLLDPLLRAGQPRAARHGTPRLLRRGPRRRPVRSAGRRRAAPVAARSRGLVPAAGGDRPGQSLRRLDALAQARGRAPAGAGTRRPRPPARRRADRLRRARRPRPAAPRRPGGRGAGGRDARAGRGGGRGPAAQARGGEGRRRAGRRLRPRRGPARGRLQPRPAKTDRGGSLSAFGHNRDMADSGESQGPVELLRSVPLFSDLEGEELERFSRVAVPRAFPAATRVFHEGDHSDACYIVRSGSFRVTREHSDGRAITLATLGPGDIFGELAMLDGEVRSASVESLVDGELLALPAGEVRALLARHPDITVKLVAALVRRLRTANERISRQSFQTVPSRVAGVLSQLVAEEMPRGPRRTAAR